MRRPGRAVSLLVLVLLVAGAVGLLSSRSGDLRPPVGPAGEPAPRVEVEASRPRLAGRGEAQVGAASVPRPRDAAPASSDDVLRVLPATRAAVTLFGRVEDARGVPQGDARVFARAVPVPQHDPLRIADDRDVAREVRSGADGAFVLPDLPEGPYRMHAVHGDLRSATLHTAAREGRPIVTLRLTERTADFALRVLVLDGDGEAPVPGAIVEVHGDPVPGLRGAAPTVWRGTTDVDGTTTWDDVELHGAVVWARGPDGGEGIAALGDRGAVVRAQAGGGVEIRLRATGALEGRVATADGEPAGDAIVEAHLRSEDAAYHTSLARAWRTALVGGRYAFEALPAGRYHLHVRGGGWRLRVPWVQDGRFPEPVVAAVEAESRTRQDLVVARGAVLDGRVTTGGRPVAGARVRATRDPRTSNVPDGVVLHGTFVRRYDGSHLRDPDHPLTHHWTVTDASGVYRFDTLEPGPYRVEVFASGFSLGQAPRVEIDASASTTRDFTLVAAGVLQGVAPTDGYFGARRIDAAPDVFEAIAILPRSGLFTFAGLPPGEYELGAPYWNRSTKVYGRARVEAGRTTWIDLEAGGDRGVRGRVSMTGRGLARATVRNGDRATRTDDEGRFELRWGEGSEPKEPYVDVVWLHPRGGYQTWRVRIPPESRSDVADLGDVEVGSLVLSVRTVDADGRPVEAEVFVRGGTDDVAGADPARPLRFAARVRTGADGMVHVPGCFADEACRAVATFEGGLEVEARFALPRSEPVLLRRAPVGTLDVFVAAPDGAPASGAWVVATTWRGPGAPPADPDAWGTSPDRVAQAEGKADGEGRVRLPGVVAGAVQVVARRTGFLAPAQRAHARIELKPGEEQELDLRLAAE